MGMLKEFKDFALRGNVVDMAVGVVIGAAFGKSFLLWSAMSSCLLWATCWVVSISPTFSFPSALPLSPRSLKRKSSASRSSHTENF